VSPYEADPQIAHLLESNLADFAVSEDSDLLAYGCSKVLFKMDFNGGADMIKLSKALDHLHMEITNFQTMCIVAGCDYLKNIRGIGIKRAKDIVTQGGYKDVLSNNPNAPPGYINDLRRAEFIFRHQTVFNVSENCLMPLHPWTRHWLK